MKYSFIIWTIFIKWPAIQFHAGPPSLITENCELITSSSKFLENDSYSAFGLKTQKPPSALQKEAHGRGTTLTYHLEYKKVIKKPCPSDKGAQRAVPPCIILISITGTPALPTFFSIGAHG